MSLFYYRVLWHGFRHATYAVTVLILRYRKLPLTTPWAYTKEIKNAPSALLSYISTREFLRTREKCREARAVGECLSALLECF